VREFAGLLKETGLVADAVVVAFDGESYKDQDAVLRTVGLRPAALRPARMDYARRQRTLDPWVVRLRAWRCADEGAQSRRLRRSPVCSRGLWRE
jgi:1,2-phenylacetyl-CoA epoxidase PaaB subunit